MPTLCWIANADGYIVWCNQRWHDYCGSTPADMQGWGWQSVHDPAVLPRVLDEWTRAISSGTAFEMTFPLRAADGTFRPFKTQAHPHRNSHGHIDRWFGINIDVTAEVDADQRLRAANAALAKIVAEREAILSQLGEGVIVTDPTGKITFVNDAARRLHGVTKLAVGPDDYTRAYSLFTLDGTPHPPETLPLTRAVRDHEVVVDARWIIRHPDGTEVLAIGNARPVLDLDGNAIGAVLTIRDDTERHAAETALAETVKVKDVLLHEVNHRVKNSLQLVTSLLQLQASKATSPELKQNLLEARSRIAVVASLHQRLYMTGQHDHVSLATYLHDMATETISALDGDTRLALRFTCPPDLTLPLDRAVPLALVMSELLTNAIKYAFDEDVPGTIDLTTTQEAGMITITLDDDGCGLPPAFDPAQSNGIGMRIVTALTRQLHGTLTIAALDRGTRFTLSFPATV